MEFRYNTDALRPARGVEVETPELINLVLVMRGEPIIRSRQSLFFFELHIGRNKRERNKPLCDFGSARGCRVLKYRWIPQRQRFVRLHGSIISGPVSHNCLRKTSRRAAKNIKIFEESCATEVPRRTNYKLCRRNGTSVFTVVKRKHR